jgi:hypothetical protein
MKTGQLHARGPEREQGHVNGEGSFLDKLRSEPRDLGCYYFSNTIYVVARTATYLRKPWWRNQLAQASVQVEQG